MFRKLYFSKSVDLKNTKQKQKKKFTHKFSGNATYNKWAKFKGKIVSPTLVGGPGSFHLIN